MRRIFEWCAQGSGKTRIAKTLNEQGAPAPRAQQGRPRAWAPSTVHEVLHRPLYRGEIVWNQTKKRNPWGQQHQTARPPQDWMRLDTPALRIVSEELWTAAHRRLEDARSKYLRGTDGRLWGRPSGNESKYLLPGFARCACCNGVMHVRTRSHGRRRAAFYGCTSYWKRGRTVCANRLEARMEQIDQAVLQTIQDQVLSADMLDEIVGRAFAAVAARDTVADLERLRREQHAVDLEIARYVQAIGAGGDVPELVTAVKARRTRRTELTNAITALERQGERLQGPKLLEELERRARGAS